LSRRERSGRTAPSAKDPFDLQPRDEGGPVFAEPWQAQAFALAVNLSEAGWFTWPEWAAALGKLVAAKGLAEPAALLARKEEWAEAYRSTPHGKPVELVARRQR